MWFMHFSTELRERNQVFHAQKFFPLWSRLINNSVQCIIFRTFEQITEKNKNKNQWREKERRHFFSRDGWKQQYIYEIMFLFVHRRFVWCSVRIHKNKFSMDRQISNERENISPTEWTTMTQHAAPENISISIWIGKQLSIFDWTKRWEWEREQKGLGFIARKEKNQPNYKKQIRSWRW